ncbi:related to IMP1 Protease, mitochondrial [Ramularia collo-cygni]|uniref:Related to IMP1 Protease, mitochondrial n=1 Tax=Ramularia collo-cygni TaxID=112498 RepID=A0A2D3VK74_9PEZI|nr:related to IMP1 Protease, mitochondrial [Ramularia collo-cygni]CZT24881.1 related to IMP1 Protease, mitochondrial [Ramularia collo-cygni]
MLRSASGNLGATALRSRPGPLRTIRLASSKAPDAKTKTPPSINANPRPKQAHYAPPISSRNGIDWSATYRVISIATKCMAAVFLAGHIFVEYFYMSSAAYGISMVPNLNSTGDWLWISKYYRRGRGIEVGDLVSFQHPVREGDYAVKRVMGLEGDFVLMNTPGKSDAMIQIPEGHCWVVGDNLPHSRDSRMFGPLPLALIAGKVIARWGMGDLEWLPRFQRLDRGLSDGDDSDSIVN